MAKKRLYTWAEALTSVREGAGPDAEFGFAQAIETISRVNADMATLKRAKEDAVWHALTMVNEYIGADAQFIGPDGVIFERQTGAAVSYPLDALRAAGVTNEQLAAARKESKWQTVAAARS